MLNRVLYSRLKLYGVSSVIRIPWRVPEIISGEPNRLVESEPAYNGGFVSLPLDELLQSTATGSNVELAVLD